MLSKDNAYFEEIRCAFYENNVKFPFVSGAVKAYHAWVYSLACKEEELEMSSYLWEGEAADFVEALRNAGITSFVYTNQNMAVMDTIHAFVAEGCTMTGLCTVTRHETCCGEEEATHVNGIRFTL